MRLITVILKTDGFKIVRHGNNTLYLNCRHCVPDSVVNLSDHSVYPSFYLLVCNYCFEAFFPDAPASVSLIGYHCHLKDNG